MTEGEGAKAPALEGKEEQALSLAIPAMTFRGLAWRFAPWGKPRKVLSPALIRHDLHRATRYQGRKWWSGVNDLGQKEDGRMRYRGGKDVEGLLGIG